MTSLTVLELLYTSYILDTVAPSPAVRVRMGEFRAEGRDGEETP